MGVEKLARRQDSIPACALRDSRGMVTNRTGSSHQARGPGGSASRSDRGASVFRLAIPERLGKQCVCIWGLLILHLDTTVQSTVCSLFHKLESASQICDCNSEVLQLCSLDVIGWLDAPSGFIGLLTRPVRRSASFSRPSRTRQRKSPKRGEPSRTADH